VIALPALAGVPVVTMANDTWASALGLGAVVPGGAYALSGTTEVLGVLGTRPATADGLLTLAWGDLWHLGGPSQAGADCLAWLGEVLGIAPSAVDPLLQEARDPHPPVFLPHLAGARVPYWDDQRRGAFIGLSRSHTATDLAWAVIEGVAALNRAVLERAEAALGQPISALRVGGGAAASAAWCQTKSDMLNRPVETVATADPGLTGAAIAAAVALGHHPDLAAAQAAMVTPARRFTPDAARHQALTHGYHAYVAADAALAALTRTLGDVG
jgi:xylulokinase